jgi:hypothetical protein
MRRDQSGHICYKTQQFFFATVHHQTISRVENAMETYIFSFGTSTFNGISYLYVRYDIMHSLFTAKHISGGKMRILFYVHFRIFA